MSRKIVQNYYKIVYFCLLLAVFLPLIFYRNTFSPFHFTKNLLFRVLVETLFVFWLVLAWADKRYRPRLNLLFWLVNAWFLSYLITSVLGVDWSRSFWGTLERMGGFILQLHLWLYLIILISVFKTKEQWFSLLRLSIVASFLCSLYALAQKANLGFVLGGGRERVFGTVGNPALFAGYTLFNFFWALYFILKRDARDKWRKFFVGVAVLQFVTILLTAVRGAIIALLFGLVLLGILYIFLQRGKKTKIVILGAIAPIVILSSALYLARGSDAVRGNEFLRRVTDISLQTETIQTRLTTWHIALKAAASRPVFGWGPENFSVAFAQYFDPVFFKSFGSETFWDRAHNVFLDILTAQGIFGLAVYFCLLGGVFFSLYKIFREGDDEARWLGAVLLVILLVYHIHTFFIFDVFSTDLMLIIFLGMVYFIYAKFTGREPETKEPEMSPPKPRKFVLVGGLFIVFILFFVLAVAPFKTNYLGTRAVVADWQHQHEQVIGYYQRSLESGAFPAYEIRHKLAGYAFSVASAQKLSQGEIIKTLDLAISETQKNIDQHPKDYLPYLYLGRVLNYKARYNNQAVLQARDNLQKALALNPAYPRIYYELGQNYILQGDYQNALKIFQEALNLNQKVAISYWYVAATYARLGDYQQAAKYVLLAQERGYEFNQKEEATQAVVIFNEIKETAKVAEFSQKVATLDPTAQNYASLAVALKQNGQYQEAILAAQKAAEIDPGFAREAQIFISQTKPLVGSQ
ncbi:MAG: hypothetical protein COU85_01855 [Candidatus Portnoybacteria bacterium CG10_big_fil_rev_8_21_14_0_10_44_7]|uniref:O-antigen ligase-related domain-containing protein n=1 Tax=Candidatus Portnoybacteria bacterium CG10_big_fil_rev_8_21_14_0_10_44_7 TaxID=1974816 RepID=A0A2M8KIQ8_9BACT|nr:MAG: hypothetical protein COU85_01855 [Candidatus Portnoybacteria bacterium CG10_big_fil_rev_8_21_14_0_10_44_7]